MCLEYGEIAGPLPRPVVGIPLFRWNPADEEPSPLMLDGLGRVERPSVDGVATGCEPRSVRMPRDPVARLEGITELRVHEVPPVAPLEHVGTLLRDEPVRLPQRLRD